MHCWCSELMCELLISLDLDLKLDNAIISLALSFCYLEGNNVGHKIPVISTTFHTKQRICIGREEKREERDAEIGCYQRPNWDLWCCITSQDVVLNMSTFFFVLFHFVSQLPSVQMILRDIIDTKMSTSSLFVLYLCWVFIILHVFIVKN